MSIAPKHLTARSFYPLDGVKRPHWLLIIVAFIIFFPVGIYFLHERVKITRGRNAAAAVTLTWSIIGAVFTGLVILGGGGILSWIMLAFFIFSFLYGLGEKEQWKEYGAYISLLMSGEWYLPIIAEATGTSEKDAAKNLTDMFADGIFPGSYIDMSDLTVETNYSCLAKLGMYAPELKKIYVSEADYPQPTYTKTVVRCTGCGANAEGIVGQTSNCEFCDSPISFE